MTPKAIAAKVITTVGPNAHLKLNRWCSPK
jgi:hypothetical protein